jgi:hypothetical protein
MPHISILRCGHSRPREPLSIEAPITQKIKLSQITHFQAANSITARAKTYKLEQDHHDDN